MHSNKTILITGADGFVGKNAYHRLIQEGYCTNQLIKFTKSCSDNDLKNAVKKSDIILHFAGVNRPKKSSAFLEDNTNLTRKICEFISSKSEKLIIFSSTIQATSENDYGQSKLQAEQIICEKLKNTSSKAIILRLTNLFGKWSREHYNSVVSTFCYQIARNQEITISCKKREVTILYIDDFLDEMISVATKPFSSHQKFLYIEKMPFEYKVTLEELANKILSFQKMRKKMFVPDFSDDFTKKLYATFISYLPEDQFDYEVPSYQDDRGSLVELVKSQQFGQIFFSRTKPGITRGNHYHNTKVEKFMVVHGEALIQFRNINEKKVFEYKIKGSESRILDIPVGYTHNITNIGKDELLVVFYANEVFDKNNADTFFEEV